MNTFSVISNACDTQVSIELYYCTETHLQHTIFIGYQFLIIGHTHLHLFNYMVEEQVLLFLKHAANIKVAIGL